MKQLKRLVMGLGGAALMAATGCATKSSTQAAPPAPTKAESGIVVTAPAAPAPNVTPRIPPSPSAPRPEPAAPAQASAPRLAPEQLPANPEIEEQFLFAPGVARQMISDTVSHDDGETSGTVFDAVGQEAERAYVRGALQNQTGYTTKALDSFVQAVERDPDNLWLKIRTARAALYLNDLPRARRLCEDVLKADEKNYQAMEVMAEVAMSRGKRDEAIEWYKKIIEVKDHNISALESLARMAYEAGDLEQTKLYCGKILEVTSRNLNAILWHAEASALTGDIKYASDLYEELIRYRPTLISRVGEMGIRLYKQGRGEDALELYRRGVAMQPETEPIRLQWEALLRELRGAEAVEAGYEQFAKDYPLDLRIQEIVADYYLRVKATDKLIAKRKEMLDIDPRHVESLLSLASIALDKGDLEEANGYFDRAIKAGPQHAATYRDIAEVYLKQGKTDRVESLLHDALAIDPSDSETYVSMAELAEKLGKKEDAERDLKKALDLAPASDRVLRLLGNFYQREGKLYEASQLYEQLIAVDPTNEDAEIGLAALYMELGNEAALDQAQDRVALVGKQMPRFFSDYGALAMRHGEWDRAAWGLQRAIEQYPNNVPLYQALSSAYLHKGDASLAEKTILEAKPKILATEEGQTEYDMTLVSLYVQSRQHEKAVGVLREVMAREPKELSVRNSLVESLVALGRKDEAQQVVNDTIRDFATEDAIQVKRFRASFYRLTEDYDRAIQVLTPLLSEAQDPHEIWFELALTNGEKGDVEAAESWYKRVIDKLDPEKDNFYLVVNSYNNLAYLYAEKNVKIEDADKYVTKALELNPGADYIVDTQAWVRFRQGNFEEAEKLLKKSEKLSLPDAEIYTHLAQLYNDTGRRAQALEYYRKALAIDPDAKDVQERIAALSAGAPAQP